MSGLKQAMWTSVYVGLSRQQRGNDEVNKLCVRSSPADVCFVEEEQQASCGQTRRSRVNNRPHSRAAAAALQRAVDAEEETGGGGEKDKQTNKQDTRLTAEGHV